MVNLTSRSFIARTRAQLVFEALEEDCRFIAGGLSKRDDPDGCGRFSVDERNGEAPKKPERNKASLAIIEAGVFERKS